MGRLDRSSVGAVVTAQASFRDGRRFDAGGEQNFVDDEGEAIFVCDKGKRRGPRPRVGQGGGWSGQGVGGGKGLVGAGGCLG